MVRVRSLLYLWPEYSWGMHPSLFWRWEAELHALGECVDFRRLTAAGKHSAHVARSQYPAYPSVWTGFCTNASIGSSGQKGCRMLRYSHHQKIERLHKALNLIKVLVLTIQLSGKRPTPDQSKSARVTWYPFSAPRQTPPIAVTSFLLSIQLIQTADPGPTYATCILVQLSIYHYH